MQNFTPLSGMPQGGMIDGLATNASRTIVHTVPEGETHLITVRVHNTHNSAAVRVVGELVGDTAQNYVIDQEGIISRSTAKILDQFCADGPCTIGLAGIANASSINCEGYAQIIRRK